MGERDRPGLWEVELDRSDAGGTTCSWSEAGMSVSTFSTSSNRENVGPFSRERRDRQKEKDDSTSS